MPKPKIYREKTFKDYPIYLDSQGSRLEILTAILQIFEFMWTACHRRLFVIHFTVHIPDEFNQQGNDLISGTLQSWRRTMLNRKIKAEYVWCRERGHADYNFHPHHHVFVVIDGKHVQSAANVVKRLNSLLSKRVGGNVNRFHCNPPQNDAFRWGKKVSAKLGNFADAIFWVSYAAKIDTKTAPFGQKTFGFSKGFLLKEFVPALTAEREQFEEAQFDSADLLMTDEEWIDWGPSLDWEELLDFDPLTGGSKKAAKASSMPIPSTEGGQTGQEAV